MPSRILARSLPPPTLLPLRAVTGIWPLTTISWFCTRPRRTTIEQHRRGFSARGSSFFKFWLRLDLFMQPICFLDSGATSTELAPGSLNLVFLYHCTHCETHPSPNALPTIQGHFPRLSSSHCTIVLNPCSLDLEIVLNTSRSILPARE